LYTQIHTSKRDFSQYYDAYSAIICWIAKQEAPFRQELNEVKIVFYKTGQYYVQHSIDTMRYAEAAGFGALVGSLIGGLLSNFGISITSFVLTLFASDLSLPSSNSPLAGFLTMIACAGVGSVVFTLAYWVWQRYSPTSVDGNNGPAAVKSSAFQGNENVGQHGINANVCPPGQPVTPDQIVSSGPVMYSITINPVNQFETQSFPV
jgi:hypothetical protein